jgi:cysteine synthase
MAFLRVADVYAKLEYLNPGGSADFSWHRKCR